MICLENVRQLISNNRGETFAVILRALADLGYAVEHRILDARNFGLPQKRERVLIVGARGGFADGGFAWPTRKIPMKPLAEILETAPPPRFYASARIRENRRRKHKAAQRPAIWHETKAAMFPAIRFLALCARARLTIICWSMANAARPRANCCACKDSPNRFRLFAAIRKPASKRATPCRRRWRERFCAG